MAIHFHTTAAVPTEDEINFTHSPISRAFSRLLIDLAAYIEAERDLADTGNSLDVAFSGWLREVEEAQERVTTLLCEIHQLEARRPEDRPLQRMCLVLDELLGSENPEEFDRLHRMLGWCEELFTCKGTNAVARRVTHMLEIGRRRIDEVAALDCHASGLPPSPH